MQVDHDQRNLRVTEGNDVDLDCSLTKYGFGPGTAFSLTWFYTGPLPGENVTLAELSQEGLLTRPWGGGPGRRLTLSRPDRCNFRLSLQSAQPGDGGHYWCRVEQHRLGQEGRWQLVAVDTSGRTHLTVGDPGTMAPGPLADEDVCDLCVCVCGCVCVGVCGCVRLCVQANVLL
jgi:hypothetical protein